MSVYSASLHLDVVVPFKRVDIYSLCGQSY